MNEDNFVWAAAGFACGLIVMQVFYEVLHYLSDRSIDKRNRQLFQNLIEYYEAEARKEKEHGPS